MMLKISRLVSSYPKESLLFGEVHTVLISTAVL